MYNNELYHYGVLGMKWGVRKDRGSSNSGRVSKAANAARSRIQVKRAARIQRRHDKAMSRRSSARYTYRNRHLLSDDELRYRLNRLNMEKQLKDLSKSNDPATQTLKTGKNNLQRGIAAYGSYTLAEAMVPGMGSFIGVPTPGKKKK